MANFSFHSAPMMTVSSLLLFFDYHSIQGEDYACTFSFLSLLLGFVGLVNQAMTCYLNSLLQTLYMTPEFRNAVYLWKYEVTVEKDAVKCIPYQLQRLFLQLQVSECNGHYSTILA